VAIVVFAALDAFSFALLIPFLRAIFGGAEDGVRSASGREGTEGAGGAVGGGEASDGVAAEGGTEGGFLDALLDGTVGRFVDLGGEPGEAIQGIILFILAVFLLKNVFDFVRTYLVARVEQGVARDLRNEVYDHLLSLDLAFFGRTRTGQIVSRLTHDVEQLRGLVTRELARAVSSVLELAAAVALMVAISAKLTLAAFVVVPATMGVWGPLLRRLRSGDRKVLDLAGDVNAHLQETLAGIRLVKASTAEGRERRRFRELTGAYFGTLLRTERLRAMAGPATEMLCAVGTVILLGYGAHLVLVAGEIGGEAFIGFLALSMKLYSPVKHLSKFPTLVQPGLAGAERIFRFLDAPVEIRDRPGARSFPGLRREIVYERVSFGYREGEPVLRDLSFRVSRGSVVALVGRSGSGKSTLVDLLARFYEPTEGRILVDGADLREYTVESLRDSLGIVSQETVLFHDTVRANIAYGCEEASAEGVEAAARAACAHEFIARLPQGYDTVVGERGVELSGGQRQRVAIARALLRDPPILILDEATSALDTEAERLVQYAVDRLLEGRTVFVVAHRLSTVRSADRIFVLEEGGIVERGDHESLYGAGGLYRRLHDMQFSGEEDGRRGPSPRSAAVGGEGDGVDRSLRNDSAGGGEGAGPGEVAGDEAAIRFGVRRS